MSKFRFATFAFLFALVASVSTLAQTSPSPKVGYINSDAFYDEKIGITKLIAANKQLDTEFSVRIKELQDMNARLQAIAKELENMQKLPAAQFNQVAFNTKKEEGESLQRQLNYKKTELENAVTKRRAQLVAPINKDIGNGIDEFAKKNGYGVIFDMSKMIEAGTVLYFAEAADATKDFIIFYNARVAAKPAAVTPK
jgi:Skp family chaperone for outer membrane proteins